MLRQKALSLKLCLYTVNSIHSCILFSVTALLMYIYMSITNGNEGIVRASDNRAEKKQDIKISIWSFRKSATSESSVIKTMLT